MVCDIVIRSYRRDLDWLAYCLRSIDRFCSGFRHVVLVVPRSCGDWLSRRTLPLRDRTVLCADYAQDYLGQQVTKLHADCITDADYICHVDSDCVFVRPTKPGDLIADGRPQVRLAPYAALDRHMPWQAVTEEFLGRPVAYEFMRSPPYTFPRWLYPAVRQHAMERHGVALADYVLSRRPRGFSEFNALAAYAFWRHHDAFEWCNLTVDAVVEPACRVFWSWAGLDASTTRQIEELLA